MFIDLTILLNHPKYIFLLKLKLKKILNHSHYYFYKKKKLLNICFLKCLKCVKNLLSTKDQIEILNSQLTENSKTINYFENTLSFI